MTWIELVVFACGTLGTPNLAGNIESVAKDYDIEKTLILSVVVKESTCRPNALGTSGDTGLMQIVPKWHQDRIIELSVEDLFDPVQNLTVGSDYLSSLGVDKDPRRALVIYNGGYSPPPVSYSYADSVLRRKTNYDKLLGGEADEEI